MEALRLGGARLRHRSTFLSPPVRMGRSERDASRVDARAA
ncbi:hypothetical protein AKJ09_07677 [Labilithrix luteola]|uniref:Uncharacterized protein n=1 Tax=Labilithrix luteola TaxID=1391654 RepID=A0A0K1Q5L5_9BACT|nr:hypothetical protein AKJ09_07677 [Labilithrix luteola]